MSRAYYLIALTAPPETEILARKLRESAFDVWRLARDHPQATREDREARVDEVRGDAEAFRLHVRKELDIAPAEPAEPTADELATASQGRP
jgi:hypothetical protein